MPRAQLEISYQPRPAGRANAAAVVAEGLARPDAYAAGQIVLTRRGRLLADTATRMLTD